MIETTRVADFDRRLRFSLTPEHVLISMVTPQRPSWGKSSHEYTVNMTSVVVALDSGTTSTRAMVFNHRGAVMGTVQREHQQIFPQPGWVEHDPRELLRNAVDVLESVVAQCGLGANDVAALGVTNQRETAVVWNRHTGEPIANAIVWQDTRTQDRVDELARSGGTNRFTESTGLPLASYFWATKFAYLLDTVPGARAAATNGDLLAGTIDSWLVWNLSGGVHGGVHVTDVTNASRTLLMNLGSLDWDDELCDAFDVPRSMLPVIHPSGHHFATVSANSMLAGIPIAGIMGDQQSATFGQVAFAAGEAKNTYGTGNFLIVSTGEKLVRSQHGLLTTVAYQRDGQAPRYALEGSVAVTGSLVQWLRDNLGIIGSASDIEALATSVPDTGGVVVVPAFSGLFAPYWRPDARGIIAGLTRFTTKAHIARAALESVAFQSRDVIAAATKDSGVDLDCLKVDGGMVGNEFLMQFQADITGVPVVRPRVTETTALGAAYLAGLTVGFWPDENALRGLWAEDRRFEPMMSASEREARLAEWVKGVERSLNWV